MQPKSVMFGLFVAFLLALPATAQQTQAQPAKPDAGTPTFRAQSRLVLVDVVVTDKSGNPVTGLKPTDFQITEGGKPQPVRFFEDHTAVKTRQMGSMPKLPPGEYTNFTNEPPKSTISILLFDLMNTEAADQIYGRQQMLKALKELPQGQQVALFILGSRLEMIQGPSSDSSVLVAAAEELAATPSRQLTEGTVQAGQDDIIDSLDQQSLPKDHGTAGFVSNQLRSAMFKEKGAMADDRVGFTLNALQAVARMVSGYPGRKNLIWISGGIPFQVGTDMNVDMYHRNRERRDYQQTLQRVSSLLADAQIAIYPVDIRGVTVRGVNAERSSKSFQTTSLAGASSGSKGYSGALNDQVEEQWDNRIAMTALANETGGQAFWGSNDLSQYIDKAVSTGAHYYTLAYVPSNQKLDGKYRTISVKTTQSGVNLVHRKGYIAIDTKLPSERESLATLVSAMQLGMPSSTGLLMKVKLDPPSKDRKAVRVDYAVSPDGVRFEQESDQVRKATMDFLTVVWDAKGKPVTQNFTSMTTTVHAGGDNSALRSGIPGQHDIQLPPGKYLVCMGAIDRGSQRLGTVWTKLVVPKAE